MKAKIFYYPERCLLCLSCVLACQLNSLGRKDVRSLPPGKPLARISPSISGGTPWLWKCQQCSQPLCAEACVSGSLRLREDGSGVDHCQETCVGCGSCLLACPISIPVRDPEQGHFTHCHLCPEEEIPPCVRACQAKALVLEEASRFVQKRKRSFLVHSRGTP